LIVDVSGSIIKRWTKPVAAQNLTILAEHLKRPLTEEEKVPISRSDFDYLIKPWHPAAGIPLSAEDVMSVFRVSDDEMADFMRLNIMTRVLISDPKISGTENFFHSMWDDNIARILQMVFPKADWIRDNNRNTSTGLKRPDYGFLVKNNCILRGEEKAPESRDDPEQELVDKLTYTYSPLEYILGLS
jgi:hypothetical protein